MRRFGNTKFKRKLKWTIPDGTNPLFTEERKSSFGLIQLPRDE